jgi:hypothetical protein
VQVWRQESPSQTKGSQDTAAGALHAPRPLQIEASMAWFVAALHAADAHSVPAVGKAQAVTFTPSHVPPQLEPSVVQGVRTTPGAPPARGAPPAGTGTHEPTEPAMLHA